jgi:hypothetical protein
MALPYRPFVSKTSGRLPVGPLLDSRYGQPYRSGSHSASAALFVGPSYGWESLTSKGAVLALFVESLDLLLEPDDSNPPVS